MMNKNQILFNFYNLFLKIEINCDKENHVDFKYITCAVFSGCCLVKCVHPTTLIPLFPHSLIACKFQNLECSRLTSKNQVDYSTNNTAHSNLLSPPKIIIKTPPTKLPGNNFIYNNYDHTLQANN